MDFLMKIIGLALTLLGIFIIFAAYIRQISNYRFRKTGQGKHSSPAPFIGPIFTIVGLSLLQFDLPGWIWILFLIDPDTILTLISMPEFFKQLSSKR
jgi:hypothetical protein